MSRRKTQPAGRRTGTVRGISPAKSISNSAGGVSRRWVSQRLSSLNQRPTIASGWRRSAQRYSGAANTLSRTARRESAAAPGPAGSRRRQRRGEQLEVEALLPHPDVVVQNGHHDVHERVDADLEDRLEDDDEHR